MTRKEKHEEIILLGILKVSTLTGDFLHVHSNTALFPSSPYLKQSTMRNVQPILTLIRSQYS